MAADPFTGAAALVTGAASGLGEATARRFHRRGAAVLIADLDEQRGKDLATELGERARFLAVDVTSEHDVQAAVELAASMGRFAITVHCAGGGIAGRTVNRDGTPHPLDSFRRCIELNLVGTFNVTRLSAAAMASNDPDDDGERGVIVNTASIAGYEGQIGQVAYGSAKAGVIGMTLIACRDLGVLGVRVNAIAPGTILTPPMAMVPEAMQDAFASQVPFPKRLGRPDEFAQLAEHFVDNRYLNGMVARLDGGTRFGAK